MWRKEGVGKYDIGSKNAKSANATCIVTEKYECSFVDFLDGNALVLLQLRRDKTSFEKHPNLGETDKAKACPISSEWLRRPNKTRDDERQIE